MHTPCFQGTEIKDTIPTFKNSFSKEAWGLTKRCLQYGMPWPHRLGRPVNTCSRRWQEQPCWWPSQHCSLYHHMPENGPDNLQWPQMQMLPLPCFAMPTAQWYWQTYVRTCFEGRPEGAGNQRRKGVEGRWVEGRRDSRQRKRQGGLRKVPVAEA